jgi:protein phosphatase
MATLTAALEFAVSTDPGRIRPHNEDAIGIDPETGLAVLADGMGGYNAGEVASRVAVDVIVTGIRRALQGKPVFAAEPAARQAQIERITRESVAQANASIFETAGRQPRFAGMGTTLVVALFHDNRICVAHVGDSRLYRLRADTLEQITRDHSLLQQQIDSGLITPHAARLSQRKNLVTRALGIDAQVDAEVNVYDTRPGDIYLLCSDGLSDMVNDDDMHFALTCPNATLQRIADRLVRQANDHGGRDNISVILVKVKDGYAAPQAWRERLLSWFR